MMSMPSVVPKSGVYQFTIQWKQEVRTLVIYFGLLIQSTLMHEYMSTYLDAEVLEQMKPKPITWRVMNLLDAYNSMDHQVCTNSFAVALPGSLVAWSQLNTLKCTQCTHN